MASECDAIIEEISTKTIQKMSEAGMGNNQVSVQRGVVVGSATIEIEPVDLSKSFISSSFLSLGSSVEYQRHGSQTSYGYAYGFGKSGGRVELVNESSLEVEATDNNTITAWEVITYV